MAVISRASVLRALDWAWDRAARGLPGQESATSLARRHMDPSTPLETRLGALVASHKRRAAAAGFITNCGGVALLPAGVAANIAGTLFIQVRLVQAMALVCGHDLTDAKVRALCGLCLCGAKATEMAAACGARLGERITEELLTRLSADAVRRINELVGVRLLARFGETGLAGVSRLAPVVGGLVGAAAGAATTAGIGKAAMALLAGVPEESTDTA